MSHITKQIHLTGKVQGVGYRNFLAQCAKPLEVYGFARNLTDGRVEAVAQSDKPIELEQFLERAAMGPRSAKVEKIEIKTVKTIKIWDNFEIIETGEKPWEVK